MTTYSRSSGERLSHLAEDVLNLPLGSFLGVNMNLVVVGGNGKL